MIDTHCHLDLYKDPHSLAINIENKRITTIAVTNLPSHFKIALNHVKNYKYIRLAIGLHPLLSEKHNDEFSLFKELIKHTSYIGEVGLDFLKDGIFSKDIQIMSFRYVLECTKERPRFMTIHTRGAEDIALDILEEYSARKVVLHWYSGTLKSLERAVANGYYFSINTSMINSQKGQKIISSIPIDRILTESDGPYIQLKGSPVTPYNLSGVLKYLGKVWYLTYDQAEKQVNTNFKGIVNMLKDTYSQGKEC